jgi:hypothetical protein
MSVLVTLMIEGDVGKFRTSLEERAEDYRRIGADAREAGAIHHRFGVGDGYIVVQDEWLSTENFRAFFSRQELQDFITEVGGNASAEPEIVFAEPVSSPDQF